MNRVLALVLLLATACDKKPTTAVEVATPGTPRRGVQQPLVEPDDGSWDDDDGGGLGVIDTRDAAGDPGRLRLVRVAVRATQAGDVADVQVEHHFTSEAVVPLEGTFRFPLPDGAVVTGLGMMVDGKMVEGELLDNARAKKIYQEIVDSMRDPALMEWEHGSTFKMRVFPITPREDKVVTLRYLAPLHARPAGLRFVQGTRAIDDGGTIPSLRVEWNGKLALDAKDVARGRRVELSATAAPTVASETRADGVYHVVRITPAWSRVPARSTTTPKRWVVVVDTSRSTLEARNLASQALRAVLVGLGPEASFAVASSDLETRLLGGGFEAATPAHIDSAVRLIGTIEPDGATDLGRMLRVAGAAAKADGAIVYIGDCEPTWGETDREKLVAEAKKTGARLYPLLLGDSVDGELGRSIASETGGRLVRAQKPQDLARFVAGLRRAGKRLEAAALLPMGGVTLFPTAPATLDEGETFTAYLHTPSGTQVPKDVTLRALADGSPIITTVKLDAIPTDFVWRRYGATLLRSLERGGKPKQEIVDASIHYSVMSKHTSFLVLDSEEAYQRFAITRRAKQENAAVPSRIEALEAERASISADRIQPGDPEIEIAAPRDAERVIVVLPNGETKVASWDDEANHGRGAWMVRFLVDRDTPEGTYSARVYIELADGRSESRTVSYVVDTTPPTLDVRLHRLPGGEIDIHVRQPGTRGRVDVTRVEVLAPDGQVLVLDAIRWGVFRGRWKPTSHVTGQHLHVIGIDQALNHTTLDVVIP